MSMPLTTLWVLPLLGAVVCGTLGRYGRRPAKLAALSFSLVYVGVVGMIMLLSQSNAAFATINEIGPQWAYGISYCLFADSLALGLIGLTAFLNLVCVISSWEQDVSAGYWSCFLALASALTGGVTRPALSSAPRRVSPEAVTRSCPLHFKSSGQSLGVKITPSFLLI